MISEAHCIDCLDFMKQQPDKRFDLVVADPPYGDPNNIIGGGTIRREVREVFRGIALQGDGEQDTTIKNTPPHYGNRMEQVSRRNMGRAIPTTRSRGSFRTYMGRGSEAGVLR